MDPAVVTALSKRLNELWDSNSNLMVPKKFLALYNRGDNTFEKYIIIEDDTNRPYIFLGSNNKENKAQIFMVNREHIEVDADDYYAFAPTPYNGAYKSPIIPIECSGEKLKNITNKYQRFAIDTLLSDGTIAALIVFDF